MLLQISTLRGQLKRASLGSRVFRTGSHGQEQPRLRHLHTEPRVPISQAELQIIPGLTTRAETHDLPSSTRTTRHRYQLLQQTQPAMPHFRSSTDRRASLRQFVSGEQTIQGRSREVRPGSGFSWETLRVSQRLPFLSMEPANTNPAVAMGA